jgi:hypothetical protein
MKNMLLDLSAKPELQPLADVVRPLQLEATKLGAPLFLMGAAARDVMLLHAYGINTLRLTEDMDFGVMVRDWATFEALRQALLAGGAFEARFKDATHKLWHRSDRPLDIVPFGGVERPNRTLAWPPSEQTVFDCFGMQEAMRSGHDVRLPGGGSLFVASLPALALLKVTAWQDRKFTHPTCATIWTATDTTMRPSITRTFLRRRIMCMKWPARGCSGEICDSCSMKLLWGACYKFCCLRQPRMAGACWPSKRGWTPAWR